jgi:hypothetical protein
MIKEIAPGARRFEIEMMKLFFPAPLTFVLKAADGLPRQIRDDSNNVAVRVSSCETARALAEAVGGPLVSTSANLSGSAPALNVFEALKYFDKFDVAFYIDGGTLPGGASTIIKIDRLNRIRILRQGAVGEEKSRRPNQGAGNAKRNIDKRGRNGNEEKREKRRVMLSEISRYPALREIDRRAYGEIGRTQAHSEAARKESISRRAAQRQRLQLRKYLLEFC